jgi:hypothetical protein
METFHIIAKKFPPKKIANFFLFVISIRPTFAVAACSSAEKYYRISYF